MNAEEKKIMESLMQAVQVLPEGKRDFPEDGLERPGKRRYNVGNHGRESTEEGSSI